MESHLLHINRLDAILDAISAKAGDEILVVWDIDDVILTSKDQILRKKSRKYLEEILDGLKARAYEEYTEQFCMAWYSTEEELVEATMPKIFDQIRKAGTKQIALSAPPAGRHGVIDDMHTFRTDALLRFGIDFSYSFPELPPMWLTGSDPSFGPPFFKDGVIIGGLHGKGLVLTDFLTRIGSRPDHIFFVDDLKENLHHVKEHLHAVQTPHTLYLYESYILEREDKIEKSLAGIQFDLLRDHGVWINDIHLEAVRKHMKQ